MYRREVGFSASRHCTDAFSEDVYMVLLVRASCRSLVLPFGHTAGSQGRHHGLFSSECQYPYLGSI
jgi:hypothetical protein